MCISSCSSTQAYNSFTKQCDVVISSNITGNGAGNSFTNEVTAGDLKFIPFPYVIVGILVVGFVFVLSYSSKVLVVPMVIGLVGVLVMLCAYTSFIVYAVSKLSMIISSNSK